MNSSTLITIITTLAALIGAVSPIIVALIQSQKPEPQQSSNILLPRNIIIHRPSPKIRWYVIFCFAALGAIIGYSGAILFSNLSSDVVPADVLPTPNLTGTNTEYPDPIQFVKDYYLLLNNGQYQDAWLTLTFSDQYIGGFYLYSDYLNYWKNEVDRVEILSIEKKSETDTEVELAVRLMIFRKDLTTFTESFSYILIKDEENNSWMFITKLQIP